MRDRPVEVGERLLVAPGAPEHAAAHVVGLRVVRIALHHFGERGDVGGRRLRGVRVVRAPSPRSPVVPQRGKRARPRRSSRRRGIVGTSPATIAVTIARNANGAGAIPRREKLATWCVGSARAAAETSAAATAAAESARSRAAGTAGTTAARTSGAPITGFGLPGSRPSRCISLRASLRARRIASARSRAFFSEGFS